MSSSSTMLASQLALSEGPAWDSDVSKYVPEEIVKLDIFPTLQWQVQSISLDAGDTKTITFPGLANSSNILCFAQVVGEARIETTGLDYDVATPISGYSQAYGVAAWPGLIMLNTYNIATITVRGITDNTTVKFYSAIVTYPTDPAL
jgi:hypothetical protein